MSGDELTFLPFDIYQRYRVIADIVGAALDNKPGPVLDVGGYPGHLAAFLPDRRVTFCDLIEGAIDHSPYVRGSAAALPFPDNTFPVVSCCDVLEHVPPGGRRQVLDELRRVASRAVVIAGPFDDPGVAVAERTVADFYDSLWHGEHPWLIEHRELGLPPAELVLGWAVERGLAAASRANGYLHHWTLMMFANHVTLSLPGFPEMYRHFNRYYNLYFFPESHREPSYRRVITVMKRPGESLPDLPAALPPRDDGEADLRDVHRLLQVFFRCLGDRAQGHHRYALEQEKKLADALAGDEGELVRALREKEIRYEEALEDHRRAITLARDELAASHARLERLEEALGASRAEADEQRALAGERDRVLRDVEASPVHRLARALGRLFGRGGRR